MLLSDIVKLDQKNRLHIPSAYMRLAQIENNDIVNIQIDTDSRTITIKALTEKDKRTLNEVNKHDR